MTRRARHLILAAAFAAACARESPAPLRALAPNAPAPVEPSPAPLPPPPSASPASAPAPVLAPGAAAAPPQTYAFEAPMPDKQLPPSSPAMQAANLAPAACRARLQALKLPVKPARIATPGVATPLRIAGRIGSVRFVTPRAPSPYGVLDCRLAVALADFAALLARHGVTTVYVDNFYRPHAHLPGKKHKKSQHAYGLAMDMMGLSLSDGTTLRVEQDWHGAVGRTTCGPGSAPLEVTPGAIALREIVCDAARAGLFQHMLTPDFNRAHASHFHFDVTRGVNYRFVK